MARTDRSKHPIRDLALAPLYIGVGLGDVVLERSRDTLERGRGRLERSRDAAVDSIRDRLPSVGKGEAGPGLLGVVERKAKSAADNAEAESPDGTDIPYGRGGAKLRAARRRAAVRRADNNTNHVEATRFTAAARTAGPAPVHNPQPLHEEGSPFSERLTATRTARPSGVEAASTLGRAARRAAARAQDDA